MCNLHPFLRKCGISHLATSLTFLYFFWTCSYDEKTLTERILKKIKLENFQVSCSWKFSSKLFICKCSSFALTCFCYSLVVWLTKCFHFPVYAWLGLCQSTLLLCWWKKNYLFNFLYIFFLHNNVLILQLGRNKVFLRAGQIAILDSRRAEVLDNASKIIQSRFRTFIARKEFNLIRVTAITLQAYCRGIIFVFCYQLILSNFVIIII